MRECKLMVGWFAVLLQCLIAVLAASSLVYKRHYLEKEPRRPHVVWLMDMCKQGTQGFLVHFTNMGLAILMTQARADAVHASVPYAVRSALLAPSGSSTPLLQGIHHKDECAMYFISFGLDTFVGVFLIWGLLRGASRVAHRMDYPPLLTPGFYGEPPQRAWFVVQTLSFVVATILSKCALALLVLAFAAEMDLAGKWLFSAYRSYPDLELTLVMVVCPLLMSTAQYQFVDFVLSDRNAGKQYSYIDDGWDAADDDTASLINEALKAPNSSGSGSGSAGSAATRASRVTGMFSSFSSASSRHAL